MIPINQVFLNNDPLLGALPRDSNYEEQLKALNSYRQNLENAMYSKNNNNTLWDSIDREINTLSSEQLMLLNNNKEYIDNYNKVQSFVNNELLSLVKNKIENNIQGKELLEKHLNLIISLKKDIIEKTNKEMEVFNRFKEYSKNNPNTTYEEFIKMQNL